jgi:hypothetical protein
VGRRRLGVGQGRGVTMDANPRLIRAIERIRLEAEQHRIMERALAEASPLERATFRDVPSASRPEDQMRAVPIMAKGVGGTARGTDPLGALLRKEGRRTR